MIEIKVSFDTDKERALEDTRHWAALALTPEEKMSVEDPVEMQRLADALPVERAASRWIVSNDPDEVVEKVGGYVGLGFKHLVFHAPGPDQERFLKLFCRAGGAADAQEVRLMQQASSCWPFPAFRWSRPATISPALIGERLTGELALRPGDVRGAGAEDRLQGRGPHGRARDRHALGARDRAGAPRSRRTRGWSS